MTEIWKKVRGKNYEVSNLGQVRNAITGKVLKPYDDHRGYLRVDINRHCRAKVHRLVATAFCPNPKRRPVVNHINRDRHDNRACNLEWVTYKENTAHWLALQNATLAEMRACDAAVGDELPY